MISQCNKCKKMQNWLKDVSAVLAVTLNDILQLVEEVVLYSIHFFETMVNV